MTPEQQQAESQRYVARQYAFVTIDENRLAVFNAYGSVRTYIGTFTGPEIIAFLHESFAKGARDREGRLRHEEALRREKASKNVSLDSLNLSAINIEL